MFRLVTETIITEQKKQCSGVREPEGVLLPLSPLHPMTLGKMLSPSWSFVFSKRRKQTQSKSHGPKSMSQENRCKVLGCYKLSSTIS